MSEGEIVFGSIIAPFKALWQHLKEVVGLQNPAQLTLDDLRVELAELGLLGESFGPEEYRVALEERLRTRISVEELPDVAFVELGEEFARAGHLAEVVVEEKTGNAVVLVRESLRYQPWPARELSMFHELSHLAAGHPVRVRRLRGKGMLGKLRSLGSRMARREPAAATGKDLERLGEDLFEPEARVRAKWLVLAGTSPRAFESEQSNRLT